MTGRLSSLAAPCPPPFTQNILIRRSKGHELEGCNWHGYWHHLLKPIFFNTVEGRLPLMCEANGGAGSIASMDTYHIIIITALHSMIHRRTLQGAPFHNDGWEGALQLCSTVLCTMLAVGYALYLWACCKALYLSSLAQGQFSF